jgi:large subunit ribosomal protein L17
MMRSMVTSLFQIERITTTAPKAKEARRVAEKLITHAKKGHRAHQESLSLKSSGKEAEAKQQESVALAHWRHADRFVRTPVVLRKLFDQLAPAYMERNGGYTRIIRLDKVRVGDNARMVMLELVDSEISKKPLIRGAASVEAAAEEKKQAKGRGKSKEKAEAAEAKPKKEKKAKPEKSAKDKTAKPAKAKADTRKKDSFGGKKAGAPKKSG